MHAVMFLRYTPKLLIASLIIPTAVTFKHNKKESVGGVPECVWGIK